MTREEEPEIEVKANYSFWKHPIQWIKDYRMRKTMQKIVNLRWNNGMKEKVHAMVFHKAAYGHMPIIANDNKILHCSVCDKDI